MMPEERLATLEERSRVAAVDRKEMRQNIKETQADVKEIAIGVMRSETKLDAHFEELKKVNGKGRKVEASIIGGIITVLLTSLITVAKIFDWM